MSVISIRFNDEEEKVIKKFIESKGFSVSQYIKDLIFEKIEDEYDLEICKEYLKAKEEGKLVTIPFEEAAKEWDLE
ncbi:hypothetical protein JCM16777_0855 [Leptotrichia wadei]|jgi:hypothetical protein|uniref:CopG family transcriptional regulator n=1 Tax=Leptotrichia wadei TaxID=157687 RepID=A0A7U6LA15_9FUSO|nr:MULTISPECIES: DUF6290 family protein [Leptotrichia]ASQ49143.1 CopG family transcriptional regulator [Leptotrichia sp. oral taxon 498]BBM42606.1 hypothetical protein JCM16777_0855 [Leptotrichia wadei]